MEKPWLDKHRSVTERISRILAAMTLDDKLALMNGGTPDERLGIPAMKLSDGPGGVTSGEGAAAAGTQMPAPIAVSATFDPDMAKDYGTTLGKECADREVTILLAPTVNIARSPLNGRTFESYGEDPHLSGVMGTRFVQGVQQQGVIANVKHYAANNQETDRFTQNSIINERTLREIYLPAFEAAVVEGEAGTVMASYNKINGVYGTEHRELLTNILKNNWGFEGFVISDFLATQSTVPAIHSGLDYELTLPFRRHFGEPLKQAVENGQVPIEKIDDAAGRILGTLLRYGHFDKESKASSPGTHLFHPEEALRVAKDSIVLLKNDDSLLPLTSSQRVAVIGQAAAARMIASGGGSAHVGSSAVVSPLCGIEQQASEVRYAMGTVPIPVGPKFMYGSPNEDLIIPADAFEGGLTAEYYATDDLSGDPVSVENVPNLDFVWQFGSPPPRSARWKGRLRPTITAAHTFYLPTSGRSRLYVNGLLVIDHWQGQSFYGKGEAKLEAGKLAEVEIHYTSTGAPAALPCLSLAWFASTNGVVIAEAVEAAREAEAAIVFVNDFMTENYDKPTLHLPGEQDRLIEAVAAANPNTIVVLNTGGPVLMPWIAQVKAVLQLWYPGQEGGLAIASVLYGEHNPSGHLPMTFPVSERCGPTASKAQFPGISQDVVYSEALQVGYRWYDANEVEPLFPFGHGLSYSTFRYDNLVCEVGEDTVQVSFDILNQSSREGSVVPQVYIGFPSHADEPPKQLKAFQKVSIDAGHSTTVTFSLARRAFSIWSVATNQWTVPGGSYKILIGNSSRDIALAQEIVVRGDEHGNR